MKVEVSLFAGRDIEDLHAFLEEREGLGRADAILEGIYRALASLTQHARRGHVPPELEGLETRDILEIHFKPYRIVYYIERTRILVVAVADGRRNFAELLSKRLY